MIYTYLYMCKYIFLTALIRNVLFEVLKCKPFMHVIAVCVKCVKYVSFCQV